MARNLYLTILLVFFTLALVAQNADSTIVVAENQDAELAFNAGNKALADKKYSLAITQYTKAIDFKPDFEKAYLNRAICYTEIQMYADAYNDYNFLVNLSHNSTALFGRGMSNYFLAKIDAAYADLQAAKAAGFTDAALYYFLGAVSFENGKYQDAIDYYTLCLNINPKYINALNDRGSAKRMQGNYKGAIDDYTQAIKINANLDFLYNNLASAYWKYGKLDQAIINYGLAIRLNPMYYSAYNNRATVKIEKGDLVGAILDCTEAIRINPEYAYAYNNRGNAKVKQKKFTEAISDFNKAIAINKQFASAYLNRGTCKEMLRDLDGAKVDWQIAYSLGIQKAKNYIQFYD